MKGQYMFLADGFEELEAFAPFDVLTRGGIKIKTVCLNEDNFVTSSHKLVCLAQMSWNEFLAEVETEGTGCDDIMIFPGGMPGSTNLAANEKLMDILRRHYDDGGSVAAICAAPAVVLAPALGKDRIEGTKMCCYDGFEKGIEENGGVYLKEGVINDGGIITSRGAGHAVDFGLEILAHLKDRESADKIAKQIML